MLTSGSSDTSGESKSIQAKTYSSLFIEHGIVGIVIYNPSLLLLKIGQVAEDCTDVSAIVLSHDPEVLILQKNDKEISLQEYTSHGIKVVQLKNASFSYDLTISKLKNLSEDNEEIGYHMSNVIDLDKKQAISALGGLLTYLHSHFTEKINEIKVEEITGTGQAIISYKSLYNLQVFTEELHPCLIKGKGRSKEGLSLFALLDFTVTPQGRKRLQSLLMTPLTDITRIKERHKVIKYFLDLKETEVYNCLKRITEVEKIVIRFMNAISTTDDWIKLYKSIQYGVKLFTILKNTSHKSKLLLEIERFDLNALSELEELISLNIDIDESKGSSRLCIKAGVSAELDQLKYQYTNLGSFLTKIASSIHSTIPYEQFPFLGQFYLTYLPLLGYMLAVPKGEHFDAYKDKIQFSTDKALALSLVKELTDWEYVFGSNEAIHFRNEITKALDEEIGDLQGNITDLEQKLIRSIEEKIIKKFDLLCTFSFLVADIDAMHSLFLATKEYNLTCPSIANQPIIDIVDGRHLLVERISSPFISNECKLIDKRFALISGPNASGKSVYIKQVGLIVILALVGCYVPCKKATIGTFTRILTKFPNRESITTGTSFFTRELMELNSILHQSDSNSLIIIDEFSRGTCQTNGIALFGSLIKTLSNREVFSKMKVNPCNIPCTIATTHCYELYQFGLVDFSNVELVQMQVVIDKKEVESIVCFHKAVSGICCNSYPIYAALLAKLYKYIVKRACLVEKYFGEKIMHPLQVCIVETKRKYKDILKKAYHTH